MRAARGRQGQHKTSARGASMSTRQAGDAHARGEGASGGQVTRAPGRMETRALPGCWQETRARGAWPAGERWRAL